MFNNFKVAVKAGSSKRSRVGFGSAVDRSSLPDQEAHNGNVASSSCNPQGRCTFNRLSVKLYCSQESYNRTIKTRLSDKWKNGLTRFLKLKQYLPRMKRPSQDTKFFHYYFLFFKCKNKSQGAAYNQIRTSILTSKGFNTFQKISLEKLLFFTLFLDSLDLSVYFKSNLIQNGVYR